MNFKKMLSRSGQGLLQSRANNIANTVKAEQEQLVSCFKRRSLSIISELTNLMDLSINDSTSLSPVGKDFRPAEFCERVHTLKCELRDALIDWKIAIETHNSWFPEDSMSYPEELKGVIGLDFDVLADLDNSKEPENEAV